MTAVSVINVMWFDGGTRFRFAADYYLFDDISWISYYELGVNILRYLTGITIMRRGATDTTRRMLYTGFKKKRARRGER